MRISDWSSDVCSSDLPAGAVRADEILQKAAAHPVWTGRAKQKTDYEAGHPGQRYGVGFACVQKDFGTGAESSFARVEIDPQGRISLFHSGTEIGTGMSTSQALICAQWLGMPATQVLTSVTDWPELPMHASGDPYLMSQDEQDRLSRDPGWTPAYASPSSATNSAFYFGHTTRSEEHTSELQSLMRISYAVFC